MSSFVISESCKYHHGAYELFGYETGEDVNYQIFRKNGLNA